MANSKYEYVRQFELDDSLLKNTWIVIRIDGRSFKKFTSDHGFLKPNDSRGLSVMNQAAQRVMQEFSDVVLAYGASDEYSFVLKPSCTLYRRRASKIISTIVSLFSSSFVYFWKDFFSETGLHYPPLFDGRAICFPTDKNLRDYLCWRQADCHINNLYNTTFWALVHSGKSHQEAENILRGSFSADKNELLFSQFGINYNDEPEQFRKGTLLLRKKVEVEEKRLNGKCVQCVRSVVEESYRDIIGDLFWREFSAEFEAR